MFWNFKEQTTSFPVVTTEVLHFFLLLLECSLVLPEVSIQILALHLLFGCLIKMLCRLVPGHMLDHVLVPGGHLTSWLVQIFQLAQLRGGQSVQGGLQTKGTNPFSHFARVAEVWSRTSV